MYITARARTASLSTLIVAAAIASALAAGAPAALADQATEHPCVYYETPYTQATQVVDANGDAHCVPSADATAAEARGWPNFDSTAFGDRAEMTEAANIEAAGWPDFDPSDMTQEVAETEARQEAAGWPNFDSTSIDTTTQVAANSPRMTQIAAAETDTVDVIVDRGRLSAF